MDASDVKDVLDVKEILDAAESEPDMVAALVAWKRSAVVQPPAPEPAPTKVVKAKADPKPNMASDDDPGF